MIALPASPRPLSGPHPLPALEKNNFRADAQLTRDGPNTGGASPFTPKLHRLPALEYSISTARLTDRPTTDRPKARPQKRKPKPNTCKADEAAPEHKIALEVETQTAQHTVDLKAASAMPAEHKARLNYHEHQTPHN